VDEEARAVRVCPEDPRPVAVASRIVLTALVALVSAVTLVSGARIQRERDRRCSDESDDSPV
jgi:hypothetical protein